jgi:acyl carrier protein
MQDLKVRAESVFRKVLKQPSLILREEMTAFDVKGWDSMAHINIIIGLEKEFAIKLKAGEVVKLKNVGQILELIHNKL